MSDSKWWVDTFGSMIEKLLCGCNSERKDILMSRFDAVEFLKQFGFTYTLNNDTQAEILALVSRAYELGRKQALMDSDTYAVRYRIGENTSVEWENGIRLENFGRTSPGLVDSIKRLSQYAVEKGIVLRDIFIVPVADDSVWMVRDGEVIQGADWGRFLGLNALFQQQPEVEEKKLSLTQPEFDIIARSVMCCCSAGKDVAIEILRKHIVHGLTPEKLETNKGFDYLIKYVTQSSRLSQIQKESIVKDLQERKHTA